MTPTTTTQKASKKTARIPNEISEKARVEAIRVAIANGTVHPDDVSWVAAEANRLHVVRENFAKAMKEMRDDRDRLQAWVKTVASTSLGEHMDGGDYAELAGGWRDEAEELLLKGA